MAFPIALGAGIAGAAFQQRRPIAWSRGGSSQLIDPVGFPPDPGESARPEEAILAIPVYLADVQDHPRPSPWGTIGVVCFSSWSVHSEVNDMHGDQPSGDSVKLMSEVRMASQVSFDALLRAMHER